MKFVPVSRSTVAVALLSSLTLQISFAQQGEAQPVQTLDTRPLSATQLTAIRAVGRHVLAAKRSDTEDGEDATQLTRLRSSLDALIAAELDLNNRVPITVQGQENSGQIAAKTAVARLRESTRADGRALASQLRQRVEIRASQARTQPQRDTRSAGLPIGKQRSELFERWANKLDAALADGNEDRTTQLRELRDQLQATKGSILEAPRAHGTPTLQAMPAGYMPPEMPTQNDGTVKQEGK